MEFNAVVLTEIGDYLVKEKTDYEWVEQGLELTDPYIVNEDGLAQELQAETILISTNALQGIQKGTFEEELLE